VVAIELMAAAQGLDLLTSGNAGVGTAAAYEVVRKHVPRLDEDRVLAEDIDVMVKLVRSDELVQAVEAAVGELH